jgi:uncharacterized Zn ribbon protein
MKKMKSKKSGTPIKKGTKVQGTTLQRAGGVRDLNTLKTLKTLRTLRTLKTLKTLRSV